jgi:signal peptidase I
MTAIASVDAKATSPLVRRRRGSDSLSSNYPPPSENGSPGQRERKFFPMPGEYESPAEPEPRFTPAPVGSSDDVHGGAPAGAAPRSRLLSRFPDLAGGLDQTDPAVDGAAAAAAIEAPPVWNPDAAPEGTPDLIPAPAPVEQPKTGRSAASLVREVVETILLAALIFFAVRAVVQNFKVEGSSMVSSFLDGEYMLVNKAVYARIDMRNVAKVLPWVKAGAHPMTYVFHGPQRGDVIVFHPPAEAGGDKKDFIKRVIGKPGDTIDFHDNHVYVNGSQVSEPYISARTDCQGRFCHLTLGPDQYFVMGDNRTNSSDSRYWGPVSADKIIGKALLIYWCGGRECKHGWDNIGLAPNHHTVIPERPEQSDQPAQPTQPAQQ